MSGNRFIKGQTNNHLTWVMVDATDFATPESALSAATKIKIYGKLKSGTGTNFVSSGTGSLTNDITHVGASALGIYTIALAKADLSDASAAWYDQYIISLSATGAAYQTLIVDGGIMASYLSDVASYLSNHMSNLSGVVSDIRSDVSDMHSDLIVMSGILSDAYSMLTALSDAISNVDSAVNSQYSNILSTLDSQFAVVSNYLSNASNYQSDILSTMGSQFAVTSNYFSYISNVVSGLGAGASASAIADKVWSDYGSKTGTTPSNVASKIIALASRVSSTATTTSDLVSQIWAHAYPADLSAQLSDLRSTMDSQFAVTSNYLSNASNFQSDILSTLGSQFAVISNYLSNASNYLSNISALVSDAHSDLRSQIGAITVSISASDVSDIASAVVAGIGFTTGDIATKVWSDYESKIGTTLSNQHSYFSDQLSNLTSRVTKKVATESYLSDVQSDLLSYLAGLSGAVSDIDSAVSSQFAALSGMVSDVDSALSSQFAWMSNAVSDMHSDLGSKIGAVSVTLGPSDISDLASALVDAGVGGNITHVRGQSLIGTGVSGDPWRPAP